MSIQSFDELLDTCREDLKKTDTKLRDAIAPEQKLFVTLRYLATGCSVKELHYGYRLGHSTIASFIRQVCVVLWKKLQSMCLNFPTTEEGWKQIASGFEKRANFPHCTGAVDDVGAYGKSSDSAVFKDTQFYAKLMSDSLVLPDVSPISANTLNVFPYVLVGDEAFGMHQHLMRPYGGSLNHAKKIFNYRLSRARRFIECTFGIMSNKWRIFHRPLNVNTDFAVNIVKAACVLHNFVWDRDGFQYDDTLHVRGFENVVTSDMSATTGGRSAISVRDQLAEYFVKDGSLPWQNNCI